MQRDSGEANTGSVSTDEIAISLNTLDGLAVDLDKLLVAMGDDSHLIQLNLQSAIAEQQRALQSLSNISKMMHDMAMSIIRNLRA